MTGPRAPRERDVAILTGARGYPCLSIVLPTRPASRMVIGDVRRLRALVGQVSAQLDEHHVAKRGPLMRRLEELAAQAVISPTDRGLVLCVNQAISRSFVIPVAVVAKAVVEPTFATRDLLRALHRTPPHLVLVLHGSGADLYRSTGGRVTELDRVPMLPRGTGGWRPDADDDALDHDLAAYLARVDGMLGERRQEHPSPLVLAGSPYLVRRFTASSRHLGRLAGVVGMRRTENLSWMFASASLLLDQYLASRRTDALTTLREATRSTPDLVCEGIEDCWHGVHARRPRFLLVEEGFVSPGAADGDEGRADPRHDLVDDLIELVIDRGGLLAFVRAGELASSGRVALVLSQAG